MAQLGGALTDFGDVGTQVDVALETGFAQHRRQVDRFETLADEHRATQHGDGVTHVHRLEAQVLHVGVEVLGQDHAPQCDDLLGQAPFPLLMTLAQCRFQTGGPSDDEVGFDQALEGRSQLAFDGDKESVGAGFFGILQVGLGEPLKDRGHVGPVGLESREHVVPGANTVGDFLR